MTVSTFQLRISDDEYRQRCKHLLQHLAENNLNGLVLFDADYILYYTGFAFIPTERPMAFVMNGQGERALFVPRLELEHAQANALIDHVSHYTEYPDKPHPM
ncbi:MAG: aminopeptidase P family protein, partial [Chloroflexi bacterium]